ncbi:hypothetical protein EDB85DRAFT_1894180 [Lactarius pseudohatsudake]|nr:hypothetical protein EDB85DRAFT_1894180 [Lactarius pseudohatsudake]
MAETLKGLDEPARVLNMHRHNSAMTPATSVTPTQRRDTTPTRRRDTTAPTQRREPTVSTQHCETMTPTRRRGTMAPMRSAASPQHQHGVTTHDATIPTWHASPTHDAMAVLRLQVVLEYIDPPHNWIHNREVLVGRRARHALPDGGPVL